MQGSDVFLLSSSCSSGHQQILTFDRAVRRVQTLVRHLQALQHIDDGSEGLDFKTALVPLPGTSDYFSWLSTLLRNRTTLASFLQIWLKDISLSAGGSPIRRTRTLAAHLSAPPFVVDAW
jgi:hypothetical protein